MKGASRRGKDMHQVMSNGGIFTDMVVYKQGFKATVPTGSLLSTGKMPVKMKKLFSRLTLTNAVKLNEQYGVSIEIDSNQVASL